MLKTSDDETMDFNNYQSDRVGKGLDLSNIIDNDN